MKARNATNFYFYYVYLQSIVSNEMAAVAPNWQAPFCCMFSLRISSTQPLQLVSCPQYAWLHPTFEYIRRRTRNNNKKVNSHTKVSGRTSASF